jgi:hypothetical protein
MDAWEAGIFDDDLAADVRGDWEEALARGATPPEATALLVGDYADEIEDDRALTASFWIALAALQLGADAVDAAVRDRAMLAILRGDDLARWATTPFDELDPVDDADERDELADRRHATAALRALLLRTSLSDAA